MSKIFCSINGKKYRCSFCKDCVVFVEVNGKESFLTIGKLNKVSTVLKNSFFHRSEK